ncbi:MAG: pseudaminic acid synthase [Oscillospiraceae bacterium]|nr:pseudaminic acid synthase [Oscillospiraceae bacterium]
MFRIFDKINNGEVYIIAEMSANHGGSLDNALEIVRQAAKAGADCLKIQTYTADSMTIDCDSEDFIIHGGLWDGYKLYDLYTDAGTPYEWQSRIKEECESCGIDFLSTPFDNSAVDFLENIGCEAYKIASFELVDIPLIEYAASKGKPMIISCGMGSVEEIQDAVNACRRVGNDKIVLLKCCSEYPANWMDMHIANIPDMISRFGVKVGLSDHSAGHIAAVIAVSAGACVIEKHVKLDGVESADSKFSMPIDEFAEMVSAVKEARQIVGNVYYGATEGEAYNLRFRRSLYAVKDIKSGEKITVDNIRSIRPGFGISPQKYKDIIGMISKKDIMRGEPILADDFEISGYQENLCSQNLFLRDATYEDIDLLYNWVNDPVTRNSAFNTDMITFEEHRKWFEGVISSPNIYQYILMLDNVPIGQIRLNNLNGKAEIDYSISKEYRCRGFGTQLLELVKEKIISESIEIYVLIGQVKAENNASAKCFSNAGFTKSYLNFEYYISEKTNA